MRVEDPTWVGVFSAALRGDGSASVVTPSGVHALPVESWRAGASASDRVLLDECVGPTLDVGCGPGRLAAELQRRGHRVLGIDITREAVRQATERGVPAVRADVFGVVPDAGRWRTAILADGNIGIGGDPVRLLARVRSLLVPGGRAVVDLAAPGVGHRRQLIALRSGERTSTPFPWSFVDPDSVHAMALEAGFSRTTVRVHDRRWFGVLR